MLSSPISGYRPVTSREFIAGCSEQDIRLHEALRIVDDRVLSGPARRLVTRAAGVFRESGPATALASGIIGPVHPEDDASWMLYRIINASIEPVGSDTHPIYFPRYASREANCCYAAESGFALTLNAIRQGRFNPGQGLHFGGEIFIDDYGEAFALRKSEGYASALALKELAIGGIPVAPGALLFLDTPEHLQGYNVLPAKEFRIREKREVVGISLARFSGFALSPDQRELNEVALLEAEREGATIMTTLRADELQPLVQTAVRALTSG